ncbi:MAG: hypothetical protein K2P14_10490 [Anaeroplasmataceae bacterium]|nr:hypothetical protein [Anaeroplasmataceae bacterium]
MYWLSLVLLSIAVAGFVFTYFLDILTLLYMKPRDINSISIEEISEDYMSELRH